MKLIDFDSDKDYLLDGKYKVKAMVKCQDCKYWEDDGEDFSVCTCLSEFMKPNAKQGMCADDFCSYGKRREDCGYQNVWKRKQKYQNK